MVPQPIAPPNWQFCQFLNPVVLRKCYGVVAELLRQPISSLRMLVNISVGEL
jgi:hypothetical protein